MSLSHIPMGGGFDLPVLRLEGSARECGLTYGTLARAEIQATLAAYLASFEHHHRIGRERVFELADRFAETIEAYDPALLEEMGGIAEGAQIPLSGVLAVNARSELVHGLKAPVTDPDGCTSFFVGPEGTAGNSVFIGQNWDWNPAIRRSTVLLDIRRDGLPRILSIAEAGLLAKLGFNDAGIACVINFLLADQRRFGVPVHVIRRKVLQARTISEAMKAVITADRALAANYLIASHEGLAIDLEAWPDDFSALLPENGVLTHANHFKALSPARRDLGKSIFPDSLLRDHRIRSLLSGGGVDMDRCKAALRDKLGQPNAICRHVDPNAAPGDQVETLGSVIIDLSTASMQFCSGPPDRGDYVEISMN